MRMIGRGSPSSHIASAYLILPERSLAWAIVVLRRRFIEDQLSYEEMKKTANDRTGESMEIQRSGSDLAHRALELRMQQLQQTLLLFLSDRTASILLAG